MRKLTQTFATIFAGDKLAQILAQKNTNLQLAHADPAYKCG